MIDLHTHVLPGVDDGARTMEECVAVLQRFAADGVTRVACTPHLRASQAHMAPASAHAELRRDVAAAAATAPELLPGFEIMLDEFGVDLTAPALRLGGSDAVLVELPRTGIPPRTTRELERLRADGLTPVLAHPERYWGCAVGHVRDWRGAGAVMQGDAATLVGQGPKGRFARTLLAQGLLDLVASDNHGDARSLAAVATWLRELGATESCELLTRENPARVLSGEAPLPVPPVLVPPGLLARLRALLLGREPTVS